MTAPRPQASSIPDAPGAYLFRDGDGRVIYAGKASSLRKRLASYWGKPLHPRTQAQQYGPDHWYQHHHRRGGRGRHRDLWRERRAAHRSAGTSTDVSAHRCACAGSSTGAYASSNCGGVRRQTTGNRRSRVGNRAWFQEEDGDLHQAQADLWSVSVGGGSLAFTSARSQAQVFRWWQVRMPLRRPDVLDELREVSSSGAQPATPQRSAYPLTCCMSTSAG